jgi:pyruvate, orthophosphate dikinase
MSRSETARHSSANPSADSRLQRNVYLFGAGRTDGTADMKNLLGGKGANLAEMSNLGLPVPPGFTITTDVCMAYQSNGAKFSPSMRDEVEAALAVVGRTVGATFGSATNPLLVSVRSGARASMPGMMDTILNLGLNGRTVKGLAARAGDERFALDSYRRFIQMYSGVVLGVDHGVFEDILENHKNMNGLVLDTELGPADWAVIVTDYKDAVRRELGRPFPEDTDEQLWGAIGAVFGSWQNARAITYRRLNNIPDDWGTAVNVQAMVFGNLGPTSATGVAFTRNPSTGAKRLYGEFLVNAQGEDVVAGIRTPQSLTEAARLEQGDTSPSLEKLMPRPFAEFQAICAELETRYRDMQDIEFTIQDGKLWMLQTRSGKRTINAALKIAADLVDEGLLTPAEAVARIDADQLDKLLHPTIDPDAPKEVIATGLPASPGAATGVIVLTADAAVAAKAKDKTTSVILVRTETSPEDIHGMDAAAGILTTRGGMTSHAAVVARGMGRPCVCGASMLRIDEKAGTVRAGAHTFRAGDVVTIDGATGQVLKGAVAMRQPELSGDFSRIMDYADGLRRMKVRANADTPRDARQARKFGAEGIGLCRTEHMFFEEDRIVAMREMILADDEKGRRTALAKILPMQRDDFAALFEIMAGLPVTIRLLDPPLHEFLPHTDAEIAKVAHAMSVDTDRLRQRVEALTESNPMLGHRGCRLAVSYPEICEMQSRAIFEAAVMAAAKTGKPVVPEVMIPLVAWRAEFDLLKSIIDRVAAEVAKASSTRTAYQVGTMIELPSAALRAGDIAQSAEFFSFGTNDLTQTTLGLSRDDAANFLGAYTDKGILETDPFMSIDTDAVGELVRIAAARGRATKPGLKLGICGEHGGDPKSIDLFEDVGLDYVSCSPFRVPVARLAAAQATIRRRTSG